MSSPIMSYGGDDEENVSGGNIFGGLCGDGKEVNWIMVFVVLALMYFLFLHYTKKEGFYSDSFVPEDKLEYFVPEDLVHGAR
jgi:hypothetical protein